MKNNLKKSSPPAKKINGVKSPSPSQLYKAHYAYAMGKAQKMGMTDPYDLRSYANKYAISKGGKKN